MKLKRLPLPLFILTIAIATAPGRVFAQSSRTYQQMTPSEQTAFVAEQARQIAHQVSGRDYEFTVDFEAEIQKSVNFYARRIGNSKAELGKGDVRFVLERGQAVAPTLIRVFKTRNVSPLIGLYLPFIESEYVNIPSPNANGSIGMFQFVPQTAEKFGLSADDLLDVEKSADAAARYIAGGLKRFSGDGMKEALALLAYNRGPSRVEQDVAAFVNQQNRGCSICALTAQREKLDQTFRNESVYYVPHFFAAAIIGENPQAFGLQTQPLSSFEAKP
jgi:hypothetical protein